MMEGTGGLQYLLPAIIAIYVGNWVAQHIHQEGAYEADLERLGTPLLHFTLVIVLKICN